MNYYKKNKQPGIIETILLTFLKGFWFLVSWPFKKLFNIKGPKQFDKVTNQIKWRELEQLILSGDEIHATQAVINADRFFDAMLLEARANGNSFGERLRNFENHFNPTIYQQVWEAHKLRNQISHEHDFKPSMYDCKSALDKYRKGLENLGAI